MEPKTWKSEEALEIPFGEQLFEAHLIESYPVILNIMFRLCSRRPSALFHALHRFWLLSQKLAGQEREMHTAKQTHKCVKKELKVTKSAAACGLTTAEVQVVACVESWLKALKGLNSNLKVQMHV